MKFGALSSIATALPLITARLEALGGRLDGAVANGAVWTVPHQVGFERIEEAMRYAVSLVPDSDWWYGNVYDDNGAPLRWWVTVRASS